MHARSGKDKGPHKKNSPARAGKVVGSLTARRRIRWDIVGFAVLAVVLIAVIAYSLIPKIQKTRDAERFTPSEANPDPSAGIAGIVKADYPAGRHIPDSLRVAYDRSPAFGGPHDQNWATCTGFVYPVAIRTENAIHSLEHGAVWITYDPDLVNGEDLAVLRTKVENQPYMLMSPYPELTSPVTLQSWGRQLAVDDVSDRRIDRFITALRQNPNTHPEPGASCSSGPGGFDPDNPPPFDPSPPGLDAIPMTDPPATSGPPGTGDPLVPQTGIK